MGEGHWPPTKDQQGNRFSPFQLRGIVNRDSRVYVR